MLRNPPERKARNRCTSPYLTYHITITSFFDLTLTEAYRAGQKVFFSSCNKCFPRATNNKSTIMKQEITTETTPKFLPCNRYAYVLYMVLVVYLFIKGDYDWAFTNLGIALIFDPFDTTVKWQQRPMYQKAWLLVHLVFTFAGLIFIFFFNH